MARPAKAVALTERHNTKSDIDLRKKTEEEIRGDGDRLKPPKWLSKRQKVLFKRVVTELSSSNILGNLDEYILAQFSVAVDRLWTIEQQINEEPELMQDRQLMASKEKYSKDLYRCCNELCLSPQSRAKLGTLNVARNLETQDPFLAALKQGAGDEDDG